MAHNQVHIGRMDFEGGEKFKAAVEGKTYMQFRVALCPGGGEYDVWVDSPGDYAADEVRDHLVLYMAGEIAA